jgi:hypothetical protein
MANYLLVNWSTDHVTDLSLGALTEENLLNTFFRGIEVGRSAETIAVFKVVEG